MTKIEELLLRAANERLEKLIRQCETCDGTGAMDFVKEVLPPDGREVYSTVECAECHGTTVSSWGQALDEAEKLRVQLQTAQGKVVSLFPFAEEFAVRERERLEHPKNAQYLDSLDRVIDEARKWIAQAKPSPQGEK